MKPARYLHIFPRQETHDALLFSLPKCSTMLVPGDSLVAFEAGDIPDEAAHALNKMGFMVRDHGEEKANVMTYIDQLNRLNPVVRVSVILNLACNFACQYCYEGSMKGEHFMDLPTANMLVKCLKKRFGPNKNKMVLDFYGGEPLLSSAMIRYLASELKPWVEKKGGKFEFTLVTNGSLLKRELVEELNDHGLTRARVTIDGPAASHNKSRPFKNGQGSYSIILENIADVCDLVDVGIGGNFTSENFRQFPELLDDLIDRGLTPDKLLQVKFTQAMKTSGEHAPKFNEGCGSVDEPWLAEASMVLREEILKRGFRTSKPTLASCMVDIDDSFAVHYDGTLYKCTAVIGHQDFSIGDLKTGIRDYHEIYATDNWRTEDKCQECTYLPLCFGGCRYAKYQRSGTMQGVDCMKNYFDNTLETMLMQDLRYMANPSM